MSELFVAQRCEIKYLVDQAKLEAFDRRVRGLLVPDANDPRGRGYFNYTIYFDSPSYRFYREKVEGLAVRMKPRLRVYKSTIDGRPLAYFFEIKHRNERFIAKERVALSEATAQRLLLNTQDLAAYGEVGSSPVLGKLLYLAKRYELRPSLCILYHRFAYQSPHYHGLRVTYDKRLQCSEAIGFFTPPEAFHYVEPPNKTLIELKFNYRCPAWLINAAEALELERISFSKYAESMERALSRTCLPAV
jgi:hypothetical protein